MTEKTRLTTASGAPVADDMNSISAGPNGPLTFDNHHLFEKLAHFNRERIPERVVHARGNGAYGIFKLEKDLSDLTIAKFLQDVGSETEVFLRFSTVGGGQDSSDYARDPRGFAVKFYTEEGNFDIVGNNTPVFFLKDPLKFPDFVHSQKKNPRTNLPDAAAMYEFWANHPASLHQMTILMSDRGIPLSLRHMNGYASHTLSFWNDKKERFWIKWHFKTNQGVKTLRQEETEGLPPFGHQQDLVEAIDRGDFPSWTVKIQIMPESEAKSYNINPFDLTKIWPHADYPLVPIGTLTLNRNVENYFAETEQAAFSPNNMVPGVGASPDKMLQARLLSYPDAQRYRLTANYQQIPVNRPRCPVNHYQRDGFMAGTAGSHNQGSGVHFYPNDRKDLPKPDCRVQEPPMPLESEAWVGPHDSYEEADDYSQAGGLFRLMTDDQQNQLTATIADGLCQAEKSVIDRMLAQLEKADPNYRRLVEEKIKEII